MFRTAVTGHSEWVKDYLYWPVKTGLVSLSTDG